jgi:uncharacterized protein YdeI (YjbR/CyaY-like superfamily)
LRWINAAKTAPTREKRIHQTVNTAFAGEKIPQM